MAANTTDKFKKVGAGTVTTLAAPGKAIGATSINVGSTANYPTDTGIIIAIRTVDTNGELVPGTYTEWSATVSSDTGLVIDDTPVYGNDQIYAAGSTTQVLVPTSAYAQNTLIDGLLVSHDQDGTLKTNSVVTENITNGNITTSKIADKRLAGWDILATAGTRVSGTQFTVAGDVTDYLSVGLPLEFTDTTTKYGNVVSFSYSSPNTTINLATNTDYALVGNPTNIYFGNRPSPVGFPHAFATAIGHIAFDGARCVQYGSLSITIPSGESGGATVTFPQAYASASEYTLTHSGSDTVNFATNNEQPVARYYSKLTTGFGISLITRLGNVAASRTTLVYWRTEGGI